MLEIFYESDITDNLYIPPQVKNAKYSLMEKKKFLEEAIKNGGYYGDNGCWNSILVFDNDKNIYRGRVETLVIKDDKYIYLKFLPKESQSDKRKYTIPGGSFERDIPNDKQAIAECEEEARLKIKNIQPTGITYKDIKSPPKWAINKQPINWNGNYTEVYVGVYDGKFTGHIDKVDEDKFMITGKFYKIDEIYRYLRKEHKDALKIIYPNRFGQNIVVKESGSSNRKFANVPSIKAMIKRIYSKTKKEEKSPTGNQNCLLCTWCVEAWFRGIDILPRAVYSPTDKIFDFEGYDIIKRPTKITIENKDYIKKFILAAGDRSRFYVHFKWKNGNGGHEFLLINIRDEIYLIDAQSNILEKITSPKVSSYFRDVDYEKSFIVRADDKEINTSMLKYNDMEPKEFTPEDMKYIHDNDLIKKEYTDIEGEISINESSESVFDKILKLNDRLNDYEYMIPNNGNPITHIKNDDFIKYYVLLSPNEFEKYKGGVCWDYVAYEAMYFRAKYPNIKFETYYQVIDNRNDNPTHTFLIFEFNKKWYWFESSWKPNCGVYGFDNKSDCIEYIMQKLKLPGKNYGTYICKFDATDATMYGMNCVGYMNYMSFMIKPYKFTNKKIEPIFIYKGHCPTDSSHNKYYRVLYDGIGIYEAFKRIVPINVWLEFKKSTACKWLPLPPKYENNYYSYFTYEGYKKFMDLTYPKMLKYLNKDKIETSIVELDENSIVYSDKYQIVATNNNYMIESEDNCPDDKEYIMESVIFNSKDTYYNKDKFDSGEINLCFITGFSGSGKSTMANEMEKSGVEKYELDDIVFQFNFSDDNLKEYGGMINSFFNGPGKKYRAVKGIDDLKTDKEADDYQADICIDFIDYAKKYASSHKDKKFVVEGVEIFGAYIDKIESLKDYAIYIKGTSLFNSYIRSAKRDSQDAETDFGKFKSFMKMIASSSRFKQYLTANTRLNKIKKQINEYVTESEDKSELTKGFKSKTSNVQYKTLSIDKPEIYDYLKNHFSKNNPMWEGVKDSKTYMDCFINGNNSRHIKRVGEVLINKANDEVIGFEVVEKPNNYLAIEIPDKKYRGYGFGSLLLEDAIKKHGCKKLYVAKDNKIAIKMYTNRGFEKTGEFYDGEYWRMELKESDYTEASSENLFHVSSVKLANTTLEPRIPDNFLVRNGYEDNTTERISVCKSIDDCLTAMSRNLKNKDFYVYKLKNTDIKKKTPSVKEVPDSCITNEVWLLEPSEFELVGKIRVTGTKGDGLSYTYGDNTAELYRWKWSYVK